jgi:phosphoribosylamine--glycine ligase
VIEYNCRLGDPETQVVLPRIRNDIVSLFEAVASGTLHKHFIWEDTRAAATVVAASGGYPGTYTKGFPVLGLGALTPGGMVFHAATQATDAGILTAGGRVLSASAYGKNHQEAVKKAYEILAGVQFEQMYYRKDIGSDL